MKNKLLVIFAVIGLFSCKIEKQIVKEDVVKIKNISDYKLLKNISENQVAYNNLYLKKFEVEAEVAGHKYNFKGNLWLQKDSQIVVSIIPLMGIELYRICFSKDSITLIDRVKKNVVCSSYSYISSKYNVDLDYRSLQSIFDNSMFCFPSEEDNECLKKFKHYVRGNYYSMQSLKERRVSRFERKEVVNHIYQEFLISPQYFNVEKVFIQNFGNEETLEINYSDFKFLDEKRFPYLIEITGKRVNSKFYLKLGINSIVKDGSQQLLFKVPEKYHSIYHH